MGRNFLYKESKGTSILVVYSVKTGYFTFDFERPFENKRLISIVEKEV